MNADHAFVHNKIHTYSMLTNSEQFKLSMILPHIGLSCTYLDNFVSGNYKIRQSIV